MKSFIKQTSNAFLILLIITSVLSSTTLFMSAMGGLDGKKIHVDPGKGDSHPGVMRYVVKEEIDSVVSLQLRVFFHFDEFMRDRDRSRLVLCE